MRYCPIFSTIELNQLQHLVNFNFVSILEHQIEFNFQKIVLLAAFPLKMMSNCDFIQLLIKSDQTLKLVLLDSIKNRAVPSRTFVMSQIRLFCTLRVSDALFKSTVPDDEEWNRDTNFLVRSPREVSYLVFSNGDLAVTAIPDKHKFKKKNHWKIPGGT